jgi:hypothetical protein
VLLVLLQLLMVVLLLFSMNHDQHLRQKTVGVTARVLPCAACYLCCCC